MLKFDPYRYKDWTMNLCRKNYLYFASIYSCQNSSQTGLVNSTKTIVFESAKHIFAKYRRDSNMQAVLLQHLLNIYLTFLAQVLLR